MLKKYIANSVTKKIQITKGTSKTFDEVKEAKYKTLHYCTILCM